MNGSFPKTNRNIKKIIFSFIDRIKNPLFTRLSTRLLFTLTMLSAIPLFVVGLFMISVTQESLTEYIENQHNEIARRASNEIGLFLDTPTTILKILIMSNDISTMNTFAQNLILNRVISTYPAIFNRIFIVDTLGNEITSSAFEEGDKNYRNEDFYKISVQGKSYFSSVAFNEVQEPYVISSHPIRQFDEIVGILAGEIDLKSIWDLVDEIKIGDSGNAFVVSGHGQLIAHINKKKVLDRSEEIEIEFLKDLKKSERKTLVFESIDGIEMLGTFYYISEFDWIIVIQQPLSEAYEVITRMLYQVFAFVAIVIVVAILLAYLLEKRITAPFNTLIEGVKRFAEGQLDYHIHIDRYEELAVLAHEFNSMASRLLENQRILRRVERLAALSKFAALISHEIRNPLNSMNINMQILKREIDNPEGNPEKKHKYFNIIISEIRRMDNLINNFLMISRPPRFDFLTNDIHQILEEVILMHTGKADQQSVEIIKIFTKRKFLAKVDRDQMKQVFHNIVINSLQSMTHGGTLTIKTSLKKIQSKQKNEEAGFRIEFIDTGSGITKNRIKDIFEFYHTSKKTGTGLGLAIAKQIIDGHYGTISVDSEVGRGTSLIIDIPKRLKSVEFKE